MNILVTGGLGYLGGRLVEHLRNRPGYEIRLLVRRETPELSIWLRGLELWRGDLRRPETLRGVGDGMDAVVHLAALNQAQCAQDPDAGLAVNVGGTLHLLEALDANVNQFIYVSTFHAYGANGHGEVTESTPFAPVHPYAATHAMAELYVEMYARQRCHGAAVLRVSNAFGAPVHADVNAWTLVVNELCRQAVERRSIVLRSAGLQVRDFVGIGDVMRAIELALSSTSTDVRTYNVGGMASHSVLEVSQMVQKVYASLEGRELPLECPEPGAGDSRGSLDFRCEPMSALGYEPQVTLQDGVRETLQFCLRHFSPSAEHVS